MDPWEVLQSEVEQSLEEIEKRIVVMRNEFHDKIEAAKGDTLRRTMESILRRLDAIEARFPQEEAE
jgi:hypothetical protein